MKHRLIILASNSKARAELLRRCGFKFKVKASNIKELKYSRRQGAKEVVIRNALAKVRAALPLFKTGVIIAADTVVSQDRKIFGKPCDKKEAFRFIKKLSLRPSYVYSGLAVADIDNNKIYADSEVTKVWMVKLSDRQIKKYLSGAATEHINFAGGFDIQGKGSLFIERIDGCFYNVVGLPLAKLYKLLKKCGIGV